jgi:hypothetical protein
LNKSFKKSDITRHEFAIAIRYSLSIDKFLCYIILIL